MTDGIPPDDGGAGRRTSLANERTLLAWWRTGLTSLAVALGVGRLLPELAPHATRWPFVASGVGFALYGVAFFAYGTATGRSREREIGGSTGRPRSLALAGLTLGGMVLGLAVVVLILAQ